MRRPTALWNHNIHYHSLLLRALPANAKRVLDAGCGDGMLAADLVKHGVPEVVAIDVDAPVLSRARVRHAGEPIRWLEGDFMTATFEEGGFDAVLSVATLHHLDMGAAVLGASRGHWVHTAPVVWPPPLTYSQEKSTAVRVLPGVRYRRHILWRYSLVWYRPAAPLGCVQQVRQSGDAR